MQSMRSVMLRRLSQAGLHCVRRCRAPNKQLVASLSSSATDSVLLSMDEKTGIATLKMNRKPVNSLSMEFITDLQIAFDKCETDKHCRGVIFTSNVPNIFSAGLELTELVKDRDYVTAFWRNLQELWLKLYGNKCAVVAAINGHAPAGGCLMALSCDYRIMAQGKYNIGLNETQLGIVPPFWLCDMMSNQIGRQLTEEMVQLGILVDADEAAAIGLVHKVAPDGDALQKMAEQEMARWLQIPDTGRWKTKHMLRQPLMEKLSANFKQNAEIFADNVVCDSAQIALDAYFKKLKSRKK